MSSSDASTGKFPTEADALLHEIIAVGTIGGGESRISDYTGTKALMLAVLEDGIRSYCGRAGPLRAEAEAWVRSNQRAPFSFIMICEALSLDPEAVRQAMAGLQKHSVPRRIRPNARRAGRSGLA
ncbi:MAG TPA: hypothetical protein VMW56_00570 [Candidatus Margulisiibacteriota bacterium]|nr:hypothetical protein [Candidatus Margulisiibacteriota bacterium]